jgi:hypothetical protein
MELLIVVAVIVILIALLTPTFSQILEYARLTVCKAHVHQLMLGVIQYTTNNTGGFPLHRQWVGNGYNWGESDVHVRQGTIFPYVGEVDLYICWTFAAVCKEGLRQWGWTTAYRTFSMNWNIADSDGWPNDNIWKIHQVRNPGDVSVIVEENPWTIPGISNYTLNDGSLCASGWPNIDSFATFHLMPGGDPYRGLSVAGFVDGNVRLVETHETLPLCFDRDLAGFPRPKRRG